MIAATNVRFSVVGGVDLILFNLVRAYSSPPALIIVLSMMSLCMMIRTVRLKTEEQEIFSIGDSVVQVKRTMIHCAILGIIVSIYVIEKPENTYTPVPIYRLVIRFDTIEWIGRKNLVIVKR